MRAITLWQPWATLIARGLKIFETRAWGTNYRGPLAIHAAKRRPINAELNDRIRKALVGAGYAHYVSDLPLGCIVCTVDLVDCLHTEDAIRSSFFGGDELHFGDYTPGRFAWRLDNVRPVGNVPARGSQGFWDWQP